LGHQHRRYTAVPAIAVEQPALVRTCARTLPLLILLMKLQVNLMRGNGTRER